MIPIIMRKIKAEAGNGANGCSGKYGETSPRVKTPQYLIATVGLQRQ